MESLYPRGAEEIYKGKISLFLDRSENDAGPEKFFLQYELSFITADGSPLKTVKIETEFSKGEGYGESDFLDIEEELLRRKEEFLPQDTMSVYCKMWKGEGCNKITEQISARTRIGIGKIYFLHKVENFSALNPNEKKTIQIRTQSKSVSSISSSLYFTQGPCCEGKIMVEIVSSDSKYILSKRKISLLRATKSVIECGEVDNQFDVTRKDIENLPLSLTKEMILDKKDEYLPNDVLSLICECTFSTGIEFEKIVETVHELPIEDLKETFRNTCKKDSYDTVKKLSACDTLSEDLKAVFVNQCLTDVVIKTETKTFPAHKIVLCARSSVFNAMLTNDMKEKNTDCIRVDDLEDDIVQHLLLFLYTDHLENLQWDSAVKLYYAGDKYANEKLKVLCSNFLIDNLNTANAIELLLLADVHNDSDLKNFVEDFILLNKEQIIDSEEWKNLEKTNPQLALGTMHLMIKRKN